MAVLDRQHRIVALRLVYCGPEQSGKTTNLEQLHQRYPDGKRGRLVRLDTEQEQTQFFEYFPVLVGMIGGYQVRLDFLSSPSRLELGATRKALIDEADAVVFVVDSARGRAAENKAAWLDLGRIMAERRANGPLPVILQWNKRDLADAMPIDALAALIDAPGALTQTAVANTSVGVWETQRAIMSPLLRQLRHALDQRDILESQPDEPEFFFALGAVADKRRPRTGAHARPERKTDLNLAGKARQDPAPPGVSGGLVDPRTAMPPPPPGSRAPDDAALVVQGGVTGAASADADGVVRSSHGTLDADTVCAIAATVAEPLKRAVKTLDFGDIKRWCVTGADAGIFVAHREDGLVVAASPASDNACSRLDRIFTPLRGVRR